MIPSDGQSAPDNPSHDVPGEAQHYAGDHVEFHNNVFTAPVAGTIEYHDHQHHYPGSDRTEQVWSDSPYRGLAPFGEHDADVFYGREQVTAQLAQMLATRLDGLGMLLVTGPSGAGKSSLLRAGLLPYLAAGRLPGAPGSAQWPRVVMSPTADPLTELALHLSALAGTNPVDVRATLATHPDQAPLLFRQAVLNQTGAQRSHTAQERLVLVVDQFEEIFTLASSGSGDAEIAVDPAKQSPRLDDAASESLQAFISALRAAAETPAGPSGQPAGLIIIGVRGDFWDRCASLPHLIDSMRAGPFTVTAMGEAELRRAIIGPAGRAGLSVEDGLVDLVLSDLRALPVPGRPARMNRPSDGSPSMAGALPLLSQAMLMTWQHRQDERLTLRGYGTCGGVAHAVQTSAEAAYGRLTPAQQALTRRVFQQLTLTAPSGELARRRVTRQELGANRTAQEDGDLTAVVEAFTDQRLMVADEDCIELAHDILLAAWPRMADWLHDDHDHRILYGQLVHAAEEWRRNADDSSFLYQGSRLTAVRQARVIWRTNPSHYPPLTDLVRQFLTACDQAAARAERAAIQRRRAIRIAGAALGILTLLTSVTAVIARTSARNATSTRIAAEDESRKAEAQRKEALSRLLTLHADRLGDTDPILAGLLAAAAWRSTPTSEARYRMTATLATGVRAVLNNPSDRVTAVALSPNGTSVAIASGQIVQLWDVRTSRPSSAPLTHNSPVTAVAFNPDGTTLVTSSNSDDNFGNPQGTVQLWSVKTRRATAVLLKPNPRGGGLVTGAVAFSPDGKIVAAVADSSRSTAGRGAVRLWNARTGRPLGGPLHHGGLITAVAFSPDGTTLVTSSTSDGPQPVTGRDAAQIIASERVWDVRRHRPIGDLVTDRPEGVDAVAFSPDGTTLVTGGDHGTARLWDAKSRQPIGELLGRHTSAITTLAFSPDGLILATGSDDGTILLWDATTRRPIGEPLHGHTGPVATVAFSKDGTTLVSGGDTTARIWDISVLRPIGALITTATPFAEVGFSPDGTILAVAQADPATRESGPIQLWDMRTRRPIGRLDTGHGVSAMVFSSDSATLAIGTVESNGSNVSVWDTRTRHPIGDPLHVDGRVDALAFSQDGKALAVISTKVDGNSYGAVHVWDTTQRSISEPISPDGMATSVAFSPDGELLVTGYSGGKLRFWDPRTRRPIGASRQGHSKTVHAIAFSPDGMIFATGSSDRTISGSGTTRLWDTRTRQPTGAALPQGDWVTAVAFTPDGKAMATGGRDGVVQTWDTGTGRPIGTAIKAHKTTIETLAFSRDGATLATASSDGTARTVRVDLPADPFKSLCAIAGRSLTKEEWHRYFPPGEPFQAVCPP